MKLPTDILNQKLTEITPGGDNIIGDSFPMLHNRINNAKTSFLKGYQLALSCEPEKLIIGLNKLNTASIGFAYEGASTAITIKDAAVADNQKSLTLFARKASRSFSSLIAVGAGWGLAKIGKPVEGIDTLKISDIADGYGFYLAYIKSSFNQPKSFLDSDAAIVDSLDRGMGRALWFRKMGNIPAINEIICKLPSSRKDKLWTGVGLACNFTGNGDMLKELYEIADKYSGSVKGGFDIANQLIDLIKTFKNT